MAGRAVDLAATIETLEREMRPHQPDIQQTALILGALRIILEPIQQRLERIDVLLQRIEQELRKRK